MGVAERVSSDSYQETEVGLIPHDWVIKCIGDVCEISGRIGFRGYTVNDIVKEGEGAITISPSNIIDGKMDFAGCTYLSWFKYDESPEIKVNNGDILLVKTGSTFGKTAIVRNLPQKATVNPQVVVLKKFKISGDFLGYMMGFGVIQKQIASFIVGGAIPTLSQQAVASFKLPLPLDRSEQQAIAAALSDTDALISSLEKLIEKKRNIKQGAMQELLTGKRRLPGFKSDWIERSISQILKACRLGGNYPNSDVAGPCPLIKMGNLGRGEIVLDKLEYISSGVRPVEQDRLKRGDILFNTRNTLDLVGKVTVWRDELREAYYNSNILRLDFDPLSVASTYFMNLILNSSSVIRQLRDLATGTTSVAAIYTRDLMGVKVFIPSDKEEQKTVAHYIEEMRDEISLLENKLRKLREIKQGMMQNLLTGKIRLI